MGPVSSNNRLQQLEEALRESQAMAAAGQFATAMMHAINDPLEAITNLNYLTQTSSLDDLQVRHYTALIDTQLELLARISRQTRSFYQPALTTEAEAGELSEIHLIVEAALHMHRHNINGKKIRLAKRLIRNVIVEIHPKAMLHVFSSLIENALEALPNSGSLHVRLRCTAREAHLMVADNGHGIDPQVRLTMFDFFSSTKARGQGLGLAITKAILERNRGRIRSRTSTREGRSGTAFRISMPVRVDKASAYVG